jgi:hypothetical protein
MEADLIHALRAETELTRLIDASDGAALEAAVARVGPVIWAKAIHTLDLETRDTLLLRVEPATSASILQEERMLARQRRADLASAMQLAASALDAI